MTIDRPIFVLGNIRSGTTILYDLLSVHPDVCWFSNYTNQYPGASIIVVLHRLLDLPGVGRAFKAAIARNRRPAITGPWPDEGDDIYHAYSGFGSVKDGIESAMTDDMERKLKRVIAGHLKFTGKRRFLSKQTANNRRIALLRKMFPDAYFIHVIRDGRAVAASTLRIRWWRDTHVWWLGKTAREWEEGGRDPIELCGRYWQKTVEEIFANRELLRPRYVEVRYEELTRDTRGVVRRLATFCELPFSPEYEALLPAELPDRNYKWKEQLSDHQKSVLEESVGSFLKELGYAGPTSIDDLSE